jgi:phosphatidylinositol-3,4,5-trisphosphate 3-phosphatase/dual-specificity protein phosphatase PTEN
MGFPAIGVEGLYRNSRKDVKRFLDTRHEDKYHVFNFCPLAENGYPAETFNGRVSRYPFPDHQYGDQSLFFLRLLTDTLLQCTSARNPGFGELGDGRMVTKG